MNWIWASLFMYFFSVVLYLSIRKAQLLKIPIQIYSLWMFGLPLIGYFLIIIANKISLLIPLIWGVEIILAAILFSWLGNYFSQKSILFAPNPGYALIISKSYVVLTTLLAIILFKSELTIKTGLAIILIITFSAFIMSGYFI